MPRQEVRHLFVRLTPRDSSCEPWSHSATRGCSMKHMPGAGEAIGTWLRGD